MKAWGLGIGGARAFGAALATCSILGACGDAARSSYAGIPLVPGEFDPEIQSLARLASGGDKYAQLELGIRYEEGDGLPVDSRRAEALYRRAASSAGQGGWIYSPPVGSNGKGRMVHVDTGRRFPGLPAARERLARLREREKGAGR